MKNIQTGKELLAGILCVMLAGCGGSTSSAEATASPSASSQPAGVAAAPGPRREYTNNETPGNALEVNGKKAAYDRISVTKIGDGTEESEANADNAAISVKNSGQATVSNAEIETNGTYAYGLCSIGSGTAVQISDSTVFTSASYSDGIRAASGSSVSASNLAVTTHGDYSPALQADGDQSKLTVDGGTYSAYGILAPAIQSSGSVTVSGAELSAIVSPAVIIDGPHEVTLVNCTVTGDHTRTAEDIHPSTYLTYQRGSNYVDVNEYQAVLFYQTSGNTDGKSASFTMNGGTLNCEYGTVFRAYSSADVYLNDVTINPYDSNLLIASQGAGSSGANVNFTAENQQLNGNFTISSGSTLNLMLNDGTVFNGAVNPYSSYGGEVYVDLEGNAEWTLTADSYVSGLTCSKTAVKLNGFTLTVNGEAYTEGTAMNGTEVAKEETTYTTPTPTPTPTIWTAPETTAPASEEGTEQTW